MRGLADADNKKVFADGVKVVDLQGEVGAAFTKTVMDSTWAAAAKKIDPKVFANLKKYLLK